MIRAFLIQVVSNEFRGNKFPCLTGLRSELQPAMSVDIL